MVLAFVQHEAGEPTEESLQMLTLARSVAAGEGAELHALAFGAGVDDLGSRLGEHGVATLHAVEADEVEAYAPAAWARVLHRVAEDDGAAAVIAPGTDRGNEVLAHLGAQAAVPMVADCLAVEVGSPYTITRQRWGGSLLEEATLDADLRLLTVALHELPPSPAEEPTEVAVEPVAPDVEPSPPAVALDRFEASEEEGVSLRDADIVIGGGRGVGSADGFAVLEALGAELGAAVGSSRAAVNEGWRPHDDQIGLTGEKIAPTIYLAAGISGAVQHMVGCKGAEHILAINTDPEAGIIQKSSWAVIGDLHEVIPAVTEEVRRRRE